MADRGSPPARSITDDASDDSTFFAYPRRMQVRRVTWDEVGLVRTVRLQALADSPDAFASSYAVEKQRSLDEWRQWFCSRDVIFVAEDLGPTPVGLVAGIRESDGGSNSTYLTSMWVHPDFRGTGAADALVNALIAWADDEGIASVLLDVADRNERALQFYERLGFCPTGVEFVRQRDNAREIQMNRRGT